MEDIWLRFAENMVNRVSGPMTFRLGRPAARINNSGWKAARRRAAARYPAREIGALIEASEKVAGVPDCAHA